MRKINILLILTFVVLFLTGCVATQQDIASLKLEINDMNRKINESLENGVAVNIKVRDEIVAEIDRLKQINAELRTNIDIQNRYINQISGKVDAGNVRMNDYKISEEYLTTISKKLQVIEQKLFDLSTKKEVSVKEASDIDIYETARADFSRENYELAIAGFEKIIKEYPNSEYQKNAQYDIVVAYYMFEKWQKVIEKVDQFLINYPADELVARLELIKAKSYVRLDKKSEAKIVYDLIIEKYPKTEEAKSAKDDLESLK